MSEGVWCFPSDQVCTDVVKVQETALLLVADCVLVNAHMWQSLLSSRTSCGEFI